LENEAAVVARPAQRLAVDEDGARRGGLEPRHHAENVSCRSRSADHRDELALLDGDVDLSQRFELAEPLAQTADLDLRGMCQSLVQGTSRFSSQPKPAVMAMPATAARSRRRTTPAC